MGCKESNKTIMHKKQLVAILAFIEVLKGEIF